MGDDIHQALRDACLWLPEAEEYLSHGSPTFWVRRKGLSSYLVNHHGDGRVADLALASDRHFALTRMPAALPP